MTNPVPELVGDELSRKRGDTAADSLTLVNDDGTPKDLTGYAYKQTVNSEKRPDDSVEQLMTASGTFRSGDPTLGIVDFPWSYADSDQEPQAAWYDYEQTDPAGKRLTIAKNKYTIYQDITKNAS